MGRREACLANPESKEGGEVLRVVGEEAGELRGDGVESNGRGGERRVRGKRG